MAVRTGSSLINRRTFAAGAAGLGATLASGATPALVRAQGQTEIRLARTTISDQWQETFLKNIAAFEEANPTIKINVEFRPGDQYWDKLQTEFAAGQAPDISVINSNWLVPGASRGMFVDLNPYLERDQVDQSDLWYDMTREWGWDGGMYGALLYSGGQMLYYNKGLLEAAGEAVPAADWTWDDLLASAQRLTSEADGQYGVMLSAPDPPYWGCSFIHGAGGTVLNDAKDECTLNSPEARAGLQWLVDLIHLHKVMPVPGVTDSDVNLFQTGKVAYYFGGTWEEVAIRAAGIDWDFLPMPAHPTTGLRSVQQGSNAFSILGSTEHPNEAWEVVKFLSGPEGAKGVMTLGIPGYTSVVESQEFLDLHAPQDILIPVTDFMEIGHDYYPTPDSGEWWTAVTQEFGPMWTGEDTVENSTQRATDAVNDIFSRRSMM